MESDKMIRPQRITPYLVELTVARVEYYFNQGWGLGVSMKKAGIATTNNLYKAVKASDKYKELRAKQQQIRETNFKLKTDFFNGRK